LEFSGGSGEECERFILFIRRTARSEGKVGDDAWIMELVRSYLLGDAMRWEYTLSPEIRGSWEKFQGALFERYPMDGSSSASTIPTPAAAPPPPVKGPLTGRLKIVAADSTLGSYICRQLDNPGFLVTCNTKSDALLVRLTAPSAEPSTMEILNSGNSYRWLGGHQFSSMNIAKGSNGFGVVCMTSPPGTLKMESSCKNASGSEINSTVWMVSSDMTVRPTWHSVDTIVMIEKSTKRVLFIADFSVYADSSNMYKVGLSFEPVQ